MLLICGTGPSKTLQAIAEGEMLCYSKTTHRDTVSTHVFPTMAPLSHYSALAIHRVLPATLPSHPTSLH
jgi:hypothetical protein